MNTEEPRPTMEEFVNSLGITLEATRSSTNPNMTDDTEGNAGWSHWRIVLKTPNGRPISTYYSMGQAHRRWKRAHPMSGPSFNTNDMKRFGFKVGDRVPHSLLVLKTAWAAEVLATFTEPIPPTAAEVVDCLASDSMSYENAASFEDWCGEFGYDTDSRKAHATYTHCGETAKQLKFLVGNDAYQTLLWKVERL